MPLQASHVKLMHRPPRLELGFPLLADGTTNFGARTIDKRTLSRLTIFGPVKHRRRHVMKIIHHHSAGTTEPSQIHSRLCRCVCLRPEPCSRTPISLPISL